MYVESQNINVCGNYSVLHSYSCAGLSYDMKLSISTFITTLFSTPCRNEIEVNTHDDGVVQGWGGSSTDWREGDLSLIH